MQRGVLGKHLPAQHVHCQLRLSEPGKLCEQHDVQCVQFWVLRVELWSMCVADVSPVLMITDTCIANCDSRNQANCVSQTSCAQCNTGYYVDLQSMMCAPCLLYCCLLCCFILADGCIAGCNSVLQSNCVSNSTCSACNVGYSGLTCQASESGYTIVSFNTQDACIAQCNRTVQANCVTSTTCSACNVGYFGSSCLPRLFISLCCMAC
jgi:hypothetical protein